MGQRRRVGRVVRGGQSRGLPRLVAARGRLAQVQVEDRRRGPHQRDRALGRSPEGWGAGGHVGTEIDQLAGHSAGRRLAGVRVVVGQRDRTRLADGRGDAHPQREVAGQPPVEGEPVGLHAEAGYPGQLGGEPVHVGDMTGTARVAGSEPDELLFPPPHLAQAGQARGRTARGRTARGRTSSPGRTRAGRRQRAGGAQARGAGHEGARAGEPRPREELPSRHAGTPWRAAVGGAAVGGAAVGGAAVGGAAVGGAAVGGAAVGGAAVGGAAGTGRTAGFHGHRAPLLEAGRDGPGGTEDADQAAQWVEYARRAARNALCAVTQIRGPRCASGGAGRAPPPARGPVPPGSRRLNPLTAEPVSVPHRRGR